MSEKMGISPKLIDATRSHSTIDSLPWIEKYRPSKLDDLVAHGDIMSTLDKLVEGNRLPHLLLYGPPGTGKTSTILAISRRLNGEKYKSMMLELNASDDRTISVVRDQIKDFASTKTFFDSSLKLIILDEADAMTQDAQAALRRIIEKYTRTTRFCLICNHLNKISPAIQSRCTKFRFGPLPEASVRSILTSVIENEKVDIDEEGIRAVIELSGGDMRQNINILQATYLAFGRSGKPISALQVYSCTGQPNPSIIRQILDIMFNLGLKQSFDQIMQIKLQHGYALQDILTKIHSILTLIKIDNRTKIDLYRKMADIECRLAAGANEKIQLAALVSAFLLVREHFSRNIQDKEEKPMQ